MTDSNQSDNTAKDLYNLLEYGSEPSFDNRKEELALKYRKRNVFYFMKSILSKEKFDRERSNHKRFMNDKISQKQALV